ncbi:phage protein Gp37, partial [Yersinia enterocolitica]
HLVPGRVRTLFNTKVDNAALSVFACEFDTCWVEEALENGLFPVVNAPADSIDSIFSGHMGSQSEPDADWLTTHLRYDIPQTPLSPDAEDIIHHDNTES